MTQPPQSYPPQGYPQGAPQGYPPQGYPQAYPPQGPPAAYPPQAQHQPQPPQADLGSVSDLIEGAGGVPGAFSKKTLGRESMVGDTVEGPIVKVELRQETHIRTGAPQFWDDNNPKVKIMVVMQTEQRSPYVKDDDGRRSVFIKWWGEQRKAALAAVQAAGDSDIREGGYFKASIVGTEPSNDPAFSDTKLYEYYYAKPGAGIGGLQGANAVPPVQQPPQYDQGGQLPQGPAPVVNQGPPQNVVPMNQAPQAQPPVDPWTGGQAPQAPPQDAAAAAYANQQSQVQPPQAAPQSAPAAGGEDMNQRIRQFLALNLSDEEIAGTLGITVPEVQAVRNS